MQARDLVLNKSYDITSTEPRQLHQPSVETTGKKLADEWSVVDGGGPCQCAVVKQVPLELPYDLLDGRQRAWRNPVCWNDTQAVQKIKKLSQSRSITSTDLYLSGVCS
jgi:hypothetical protein